MFKTRGFKLLGLFATIALAIVLSACVVTVAEVHQKMTILP